MDLHLNVTAYHWIVFNLIIFSLLITDLVISYKRPHKIQMKEAVLISIGWISLALLFNVWIYHEFGQEAGLAFLTGYLLEEALSIDNLFVFLLIFSHFRVPAHTKHSVLFYGILGAIVMRAALIWGGIALVSMFSWIFYIFGAFLIYTAFKLAFQQDYEEIEMEKNFIYRILSSLIPMTRDYHNSSFIVKKNGKWCGTPLLVVLVLIETTDLIFALDSVPAILGITTDPFIVYTSNIFAILGLRSLFFVLEDSMERFYLLHYALAIILAFIGVKLLLINFVHIPIWITLSILIVVISGALIGSFIFPKERKELMDGSDDQKNNFK